VAKASTVYHSNGRIKYQVTLNAKDVAEGPYRRYYPGGELQVEATFDAHEKFHGDEKCYDGMTIGHYRHTHGNTLVPLFETALMKVERLWKMQQGPEPHPSPGTCRLSSTVAPPSNGKTAAGRSTTQGKARS